MSKDTFGILKYQNALGRVKVAGWVNQPWSAEWWEGSTDTHYLAWFASRAGVDESLIHHAKTCPSNCTRSPERFRDSVPWGVVAQALNESEGPSAADLLQLIEAAGVGATKRLEEKGETDTSIAEATIHERRYWQGVIYFLKKASGEEVRHQWDDLPARVDDNGDRYWYRHGQQHRDGGKPAVVFADGRLEWWRHDYLYKKLDAKGGDVLAAEERARMRAYFRNTPPSGENPMLGGFGPRYPGWKETDNPDHW